MEKLNKRWITCLCVLGAAALSAGVGASFFIPPIASLQSDIEGQTKILREQQMFLARKPALESEWDAKKNFFNSGLEPDTVLNAWMKDLLTYGQTQGLIMEKLEPAGIKTGAGEEGKNLAVFVSFQSDIRKLIGFIYHLTEADPLARVESFFARQDENAKTLSFELMLGKAVK